MFTIYVGYKPTVEPFPAEDLKDLIIYKFNNYMNFIVVIYF